MATRVLDELAARTPPDRERYVDFLRAFSIATVVVGHWFIALIWWRGGRIGVFNAVGATSGLWLATWVLQVMPIFFFVGGFSNYKTYTSMSRSDREGGNHGSGTTYRSFLRARATRLLFPTVVFLGVWLPVQVVLHAADLGGRGLIRGSSLPFAPLWFLCVYMGVVSLVPVTLELHRRYGWRVVAALAAGVAAGDLLRFGNVFPPLGWLNLAWVWLLAHQLGYFYADGSLLPAGAALHRKLALGGLGGLVVLTNIGVYPRSMVGTDVETVSNMNPPTLCIVALMMWQVGLALLLRDRIARWLQSRRAWIAVIAANSMIMTVFLWHMTAYVIAIVLLRPLGLGHATDSTVVWWLERPVWLVVPALILAPLVVIFRRFEQRPVATS